MLSPDWMALYATLGVVCLVLLATAVMMRRRDRAARALLEDRLFEQGWRLQRTESRWFRRGPYSFSTNKGAIFRILARDEQGREFHGYASVQAGFDDYESERIEILWDATYADQEPGPRKRRSS